MNKMLKIDPVFQNLIPPLSKDEYMQLEERLIKEGCRDSICIWNETIIDGHNRFEICTRHQIPFKTQVINLKGRNEAIAWICANQIARRNITEETRKYLIGKKYESEKSIGIFNSNGKNQHSSVDEVAPETQAQPTPYGLIKRTSQKIGDEYNLSHSTVEKYGTFSRALDKLAATNSELVPRILSGQTKISHENLVELSKLPKRELEYASKQLLQNDRNFVGYAVMRRNMENRHRKSKAKCLPEMENSIKTMPLFDPDAEISSLTLTIPSWISFIEKTQKMVNLDLVTSKAKGKLSVMLNNLQYASCILLEKIKE